MGAVGSKEDYDRYMNAENVIGKNLAIGTSDSWSEWMSPQYDTQNSCFNVAVAELGEKSIGDYYTCSLEIEFKDVVVTEGQQFRFWTQGAVDGTWNIGNIWSGNIINLYVAPENGVYEYKATSRIDDANVGSLNFNLGFRCDYRKSGSFRVRNMKVEKGSRATERKAE